MRRENYKEWSAGKDLEEDVVDYLKVQDVVVSAPSMFLFDRFQ
jgi:hypothetical protein